MIKHKMEQGSEAWFAVRAGLVSGTRFAALISGDNTKGYKDLVIDLAGEIITGSKEETYSNAIMERGVELEPYAREKYEQILEVEVEEVGFITPDEDNEFFGWIGISPDGLTDGMLEIKCPLKKTHMTYIKQNVFPRAYRPQVQGQLFVSGLPYCDFMSYYPGMKSFIIRVYPEKDLHELFEIELRKIIPLVEEVIKNYKNYDLFQ